jgi:hypothetical protein
LQQRRSCHPFFEMLNRGKIVFFCNCEPANRTLKESEAVTKLPPTPLHQVTTVKKSGHTTVADTKVGTKAGGSSSGTTWVKKRN